MVIELEICLIGMVNELEIQIQLRLVTLKVDNQIWVQTWIWIFLWRLTLFRERARRRKKQGISRRFEDLGMAKIKQRPELYMRTRCRCADKSLVPRWWLALQRKQKRRKCSGVRNTQSDCVEGIQALCLAPTVLLRASSFSYENVFNEISRDLYTKVYTYILHLYVNAILISLILYRKKNII
jgi:hypothetical protein